MHSLLMCIHVYTPVAQEGEEEEEEARQREGEGP